MPMVIRKVLACNPYCNRDVVRGLAIGKSYVVVAWRQFSTAGPVGRAEFGSPNWGQTRGFVGGSLSTGDRVPFGNGKVDGARRWADFRMGRLQAHSTQTAHAYRKTAKLT